MLETLSRSQLVALGVQARVFRVSEVVGMSDEALIDILSKSESAQTILKGETQ